MQTHIRARAHTYEEITLAEFERKYFGKLFRSSADVFRNYSKLSEVHSRATIEKNIQSAEVCQVR